jgi:uncharacterized protein YndB with AHSA1/START domain
MKPGTIDTPTLDDASILKHTGKARDVWFDDLDGAGGLEVGRRNLVMHLYDKRKLDEWWSTSLVVEYERARGDKEKDGRPKGYSICATKTIGAPVERVFEAWTDLAQLARWFGPRARVEWKEGGLLESADGERCSVGRVRANKDLRFAWEQGARAPGSQVEVLFAAKGAGRTGITLNHTRIQDRRHADELRSAWGGAFDKLKSLLEEKA